MSTLIEKSADMEKRYDQGVDTWGNRERRLYQTILKEAVEKVKQYTEDPLIQIGRVCNWVDIGCGGANVIDTVEEHSDESVDFDFYGCDISHVAIDDIRNRYPEGKFLRVDLEEYPNLDDKNHDEFRGYLSGADVVSIVDVSYYFGDKRPWKETMKAIWDDIRPGAIVLVADSLIPYQRRSYFKAMKDAVLLESYTDYSEKVSTEKRADGREWHRYLKVLIYRKV